MKPENAELLPSELVAAVLGQTAERVLESLPLGVIVLDDRLRVVQRNEVGRRLLGDGDDAAGLLVGATAGQGPEDWEANLRQVLETGEPLRRDDVLYRPTPDSEQLLSLMCTPLDAGDGGQVTGAVLTVEDVTSRVSLEKRLAVAERLAAVGRLAAKVAHELNNPLDGILRYINLSARLLEAGETEKVRNYLAESRKGLLRMTHIIAELLEFSRSSQTHFDELNINRTVEEAVRSMQDKADRAGVTIAAAYREENMPSIRGGMLFQVCCNLVKNAIDAMPDGGRLTVTTAVGDGEVILRFEDTGCGLPDPVEQLFEPFYTTKPAGQGTGLGLAICKDYIERLHGRIVAANREEVGAAFTVTIPLASCVPQIEETHPL